MTTREAAKILGIEITSVSRLIKRGSLKAEKFGFIWMVEKASVKDYQEHVGRKSKFDPTRSKK